MSAEANGTPMFKVDDLKVHFPVRGIDTVVKALDGVDLEWRRGEVLGIVGESGCGKSTLGRALMGLQPATSGVVSFEGSPLRKGDLRKMRRRVQMVFQDPYQSLNPRMTVGALVQEGLTIHKVGKRGTERVARAVEALEGAGLRPVERFWDRYPHELSGGQRQRVVIAAALVLEPEGLVCDEPVSALDVSIRAQVVQLLMELKRDRNLGLIFITHDVGLAWALCDRVAVMYLGRVIEQGTTEQVLVQPAASLHQGAALGGAKPGASRGRRTANGAGGRTPRRIEHPVRLPLPSALPDGVRPLPYRRPRGPDPDHRRSRPRGGLLATRPTRHSSVTTQCGE